MASVNDVMKRARAFVRDMADRTRAKPARPGPTTKSNARRAEPPPDPRQLLLPHVKLGPPGQPLAKPVRKTIWGSPAGKKHLAARLVKLIPAHKTYVEPFAGSGAVFFEKPPADTEVLADADPEIASAYKTLTTLTDAELANLKKRSWTGRRTTFHQLRKATPRGKIDKLYRFLYLSHFAYGAFRGRSFDDNDEGTEARTVARIERHRDRLRGVKVRHAHYADVVKEFDGKDTFFFLDPPYRGHNAMVGENRFDETEFRKVLDSIKGKFLVTYGARGQLDTKGFHVRKISTPRTIERIRGGLGGPKTLPQLLISNYKITQKSLGPYQLDDVEGEVMLTSETAADLQVARVLAEVLARATDVEPLRQLTSALDRFEPVDDAGPAAVADALLPIADRILPALTAAPLLATALQGARPVLAALAKHQVRERTTSPPRDAAPSDGLRNILQKRIALLKTDEERYVLGVVLEPETVDAQNDIYSADEIRSAAHRFLEEFGNVGLMHRGYVNDKVKILESYLAPAAFEVGGVQVKKGTWLLAVHVLDDELWSQVKAGELTGLSIGGSARRQEASPPQKAQES